MPRILLVLAGAFVALAWPVALHAASFRCGPYVSRGQCPEALICTEQNLSRLDDAMASLYETARGRIQSGLLTGFRDYQREWLAKRDQCGCDYQCLEYQYRTQIEALRKTLREMGQ